MVIKRVQRAAVNAMGHQNMEPAPLLKGASACATGFKEPFPQLFNAWNSCSKGYRMVLGDNQWMNMRLLPNDTYRVAFETTLDEQSEYISGRIDMDAIYSRYAGQVIEHITRDLQAI
ncbi:hypothetical protein [Bartonella sp. DGB2]|uniref:hypothetical protein n=1 Tax=Bartonella sp. DGB2 TaxID=3388426 RepID=UPI00398FFE54